MARRALLYARVSGDDRHREDRNLLGQLAMCREYAESHSYEIVEELAEDDRGASGAAFELPQLNRVRELARARAYDVLITREIDRLSRSLAKQLFVEEELRHCGVELEYVLGEYPDTPEGSLMKNVRAAVAEFERLKISERMVRGRVQKIKAGHVLATGREPYGYRFAVQEGRSTLAIYEPEAAIVRLVFQWYIEGDENGQPISIYAIQKRLSELQVPTYADTRPGRLPKMRAFGQWCRGPIDRMLKNEVYAGVWHYRRSELQNGHRVPRPAEEHLAVAVPAIVARATWERAQQRRAARRDDRQGHTKYEYLLRRRLWCGHCGTKLMAETTKNRYGTRYRYYRCPASFGGLPMLAHRCTAPHFRADRVEKLVWGWARALLLESEALREGLAALESEQERQQVPLRERLAAVERTQVEHKAQLSRLLDLYLAGNVPQELLEERSVRLNQALTALELERLSLVARLEAQPARQDHLANFFTFAEQIKSRLPAAETDFEFRRFVIEMLEITATLTVVDGEKVVDVACLVGQKRLW